MPSNIVEYTLKISDGGAKVELKKLASATDEFGNKLDKAGKKGVDANKKLERQLKKVSKRLKTAALGMAAAAAAVALTTKAIKGFTQEAVDMINDLGDIGNRSGIAADTIGALKAAFHASGQEAGSVNSVLDIVAKRFGALSRGSDRAKESFEKYGVAVRDLEGNLRSNNDILLDSMKIIQGLEDTSQRSRAAVELFGVGGQQLSQALGAGDFDKFLEFVNEFGAVAGPKAAKSAALVQDSLSLSNIAFEGFREEVVLALDLMTTFSETMKGVMSFFAGLKEAIGQNASAIKGAIDAIATFGNEFLKVINLIVGFGFASMEDGIQGLIENFVLLGATITRHVIRILVAAMTIMSKFAAVNDLIFGTKFTLAIADAQEAMGKLHETLDPNTNRGFLAFQKFQVGAAKSMKLFGEIVSGASHQTEHFDDTLEETAETVEDATEKFDALSASISLVSSAMQKLGIPKELTPDGMKDLVETIMVLGEGLQQMGEERKLRASSLFRTDPNSVAQKFGAQLQAAAPAIGKAFGVFSGIKKIIQIAEGLASRGDTVGEIQKSVQDEIKARSKAIELGLKALPPILFETLPPLLSRFGMELIIGLGGLFSDLVSGFVTAIKERLSAPFEDGFVETGSQLSFDFLRRFFDAISISFRSGGRHIPSAAGGIRFTGAEQGLAMLHRGEYVVPETGQAPQAVQRSLGASSGGGIVLNINAAVVEQNAVDELVRQIERRFLTFGSSTSPLFGGS